jgi:hypothetical protein
MVNLLHQNLNIKRKNKKCLCIPPLLDLDLWKIWFGVFFDFLL